MQWKQIMKNLIAGIMEYQNEEHLRNQKKYGRGIRLCHSDSNDIFDADVFWWTVRK